MIKMERHLFSKDKVPNSDTLDYFQKRIDNSKLRLEQGKKVVFSALMDTPLSIARTALLAKGFDQKEVRNNLNLALELGLAGIESDVKDGEELTVTIDGVDYTALGISQSTGNTPSRWFLLVCLALLLEDHSMIEKTLKIENKVREASAPFWEKAKAFLLSILSNQQGSSTYSDLVEISNQSLEYHGGGNLKGGKELLESLWLPIFRLFDLIHEGKLDLTEDVRAYLENKKAFVEKYDLKDDPRFWIDFYLMGVRSYAKKKGVEMGVHSGYFPEL